MADPAPATAYCLLVNPSAGSGRAQKRLPEIRSELDRRGMQYRIVMTTGIEHGCREALADMSGVSLTRYPPGLISALEKLRDDQTVVHSASKATAHLWIESPLARRDDEPHAGRGDSSWLNRLFETHPPLEERIAALREL